MKKSIRRMKRIRGIKARTEKRQATWKDKRYMEQLTRRGDCTPTDNDGDPNALNGGEGNRPR